MRDNIEQTVIKIFFLIVEARLSLICLLEKNSVYRRGDSKVDMKKIKKSTVAALIICALCVSGALTLILMEFYGSRENVPSAPEEPKSVTIELAAVGDNLMHMPIIKSCRTETGYNFDGLYENIRQSLEGADIKAVNQETVFINDPSRYSGYPSFGGPSAVGESLVRAGFNVVQQASNHSYDKGTDGLSDTIGFWKSVPVTLLGVNETPEDALRVDKFTKDGFTVAMLNYTYGLNGYVLPSGKEYLVNTLDDDARDSIASQIARAKAESDIVVMFVHWGTEYSTTPDDYQREWLEFFNENGVDVIIGSHPHVIQPTEEFTGENGYKTVVFYSLGNFISNQESIVKELGGMARVTLVKDGNGARVESYSFEPCFTHVASGKYTVYMLKDYTDELARTHSKYGGSLTTDMIWKRYNEIMGL